MYEDKVEISYNYSEYPPPSDNNPENEQKYFYDFRSNKICPSPPNIGALSIESTPIFCNKIHKWNPIKGRLNIQTEIIKKDKYETVLISAEKFLSKLSIPRRRLQRLFRLYEQAFKGFYIRKQPRTASVFYRRLAGGSIILTTENIQKVLLTTARQNIIIF